MKYGNGLGLVEVRESDVEFDDEKIGLTVEDQGPGFQAEKVKDWYKRENVTVSQAAGAPDPAADGQGGIQ